MKTKDLEQDSKAPVVMHGELSPSEIAALKEKHGTVYALTIDGKPGHKHKAYLKKPSIDVFGSVYALIKDNRVTACQVLIANTFLAGDENIKTDVELFATAMTPMLEIVPLREGELSEA